MAPAADARAAPALEIARDLACGSVAGMCGKVVEYPADTVKVLLQTQPLGQPPQFAGPVDCLKKTVSAYGFRSLYYGLTFPLIGAVLETAALFAAFNRTFAAVAPRGVTRPGDPNCALEQRLPAIATAGFVSGAFASFFLTPLELLKCTLQYYGTVGSSSAAVVAPGGGRFSALAAALGAATADPTLSSSARTAPGRSLKAVRFVRGMYRGHTATMLRDSGGCAAWFAVYHGVAPEGSSMTRKLFGGALAGIAYNMILFPADTIKSRMQVANETPQQGAPGTPGTPRRTHMGFLETGRRVYASEGVRGLYRGGFLTVLKSAPTSALIFFVYEQTSGVAARWLGNGGTGG